MSDFENIEMDPAMASLLAGTNSVADVETIVGPMSRPVRELLAAAFVASRAPAGMFFPTQIMANALGMARLTQLLSKIGGHLMAQVDNTGEDTGSER
jgi:hypothetical protein